MGTNVAAKNESSLEKAKTFVGMQDESVRRGGISSKDVVLPRAVILHDNVDSVKAGTLVNSLTNENLDGTFIPLFAYKSYCKFVRSANVLKAEWVSYDRLEPRVAEGLKWGDTVNGVTEKPSVTEFLNFVCAFNDNTDIPLILSFKSTSLKVGRKFLTVCLMQSGNLALKGTSLNQFKNKHRYNTRVDEVHGLKTYWVPNFSIPADKKIFNIEDGLQERLSVMAEQSANVVLSLTPEAYEVEAQTVNDLDNL